MSKKVTSLEEASISNEADELSLRNLVGDHATPKEKEEDPEMTQSTEKVCKTLDIHQRKINKAQKMRFKDGSKSLARAWIEGLHGEIEEERFDESRLNYPIAENAHQYVDEISNKIRCSYLYNIKKNCSTNELNEFCPVLVNLVDNNFIDKMCLKGHDMIKVFHTSGACVYQRAIADQMLKHWRIFQDNLLMRVAADVYYDKTTKKDPHTGSPISMQVEVLTLVKLSYERQTQVTKIFCLEFPSMQFVHDFAIVDNKVYLLQKKLIQDSDPPQFNYNLIVLTPKPAKAEKKKAKLQKDYQKLSGEIHLPSIVETPQEPQFELNPDQAVCYKEYVLRKDFTFDLSARGLVTEGDMPFQDCGYQYKDENGQRQVHEELVLLVRNTNLLEKRKLQFMKIHHSRFPRETQLKNIDPTQVQVRQEEELHETGGEGEQEPQEEPSINISRQADFLTKNKAENQIIDEALHLNYDKIEKIIHVMIERKQDEVEQGDNRRMDNVTVIIRKTKVDFFYNFTFLNTLYCEVEDSELTFDDLYLTLKAPSFELLKRWKTHKEESLISIWIPAYLKTKDQEICEIPDKTLAEVAALQANQVKLCTIPLLWKKQISSNVIRVKECDAIDAYVKKIVHIKVKDHVRFFNCFCQEKTFVFVSHDRFVSVYNMSTEKWIYHEDMGDEVREIWTVSQAEQMGKRESGFVLNLRCVVGGAFIRKLKFILPAFSKDKASGTQPQITVYNDPMDAKEHLGKGEKGTTMGQSLVNHMLTKATSSKLQAFERSFTSLVSKKKNLLNGFTNDKPVYLSTKTQREKRSQTPQKQDKSKLTLIDNENMRLKSIPAIYQSSLHPESVIAIVEYQGHEVTVNANAQDYKSQVLRFLEDPVRADSQMRRFEDNDDFKILKNPQTKSDNDQFRYHSLMMDCVRRNPSTFEQCKHRTCHLGIIERNRMLFLRKELEVDFDEARSSNGKTEGVWSFRLQGDEQLVTDTFKAGRYTVISIFVIGNNKILQYDIVDEHPSISRYRLIDMKQPQHLKQSLGHKDMPTFKDCVYAHQIRSPEEIQAYRKWISAFKRKSIYMEEQSKDKQEKELAIQLATELALQEFDRMETSFIFVANGKIIHAKKFAFDIKYKMQGMYEAFSSYPMNIVAAHNIDMFLYCLCKGHSKLIDGVPLEECPGGVYVYALEQMIKENPTNFSVELLQAHVGANRRLYFDKSRKRFMYMRDYDNLMQMPIVHTNIISFAGMPDLRGRSLRYPNQGSKDVYEIVLYRVIDQHFYAFTTEEEIYKWEINTGKLVQVVKMADLRTLYYRLTSDPTQHFEQYSIQLTIEKEEYIFKGEKDFSNDPNNRGTKGILERNFRILKMYKDPSLPECDVTIHCQFQLDIIQADSRTTLTKIKKNNLNQENTPPTKKTKYEMPQIKFSPDIRRMLLVYPDGKCIIYEVGTIKLETTAGSKAKKVEWLQTIFINEMCKEVLWNTQHLVTFTPNFSHYLDFHYDNQQWLVKPTRPSPRSKDHLERAVIIPKDFLSTCLKDMKSNLTHVKMIASRMYLASPNHIRVTNLDGIDCIFNIKTQQIESFAKVPGMRAMEYSDRHFYFDKHMKIKFEDMAQMTSCTERIIAMNNEFIQAAAVKGELVDSQIDRKQGPAYNKQFIRRAINWDLYMNNISKLSMQFDPTIKFKRFYSEKSFVLLDWLIIEKIFKDDNFIKNEFSQMPAQQQLRICYNILPNQKSLMHLLAHNHTMSGSDEVTKLLFDICDNPNIAGLQNPQHQMPFFDDDYGNTPFDYVLQNHTICEHEDADNVVMGAFNKNLAQVLFNRYKTHEFMSLGRSITRAIPEAIAKEVQGVADFMKKRMFISQLFWPATFVQNTLRQKASSANKLYTSITEGVSSDQFAQTSATSPWPTRSEIERDLFFTVTGEESSSHEIHVQLSTRFIDIPFLHNSYRQESKDFILALAQSTKNQLNLFATEPIQAIIAHRWRKDYNTLVLSQIVPYVLFQVTFLFYNVIVVNQKRRYQEDYEIDSCETLETRMLIRRGSLSEGGSQMGWDVSSDCGWFDQLLNKAPWLFVPTVYYMTLGILFVFSLYFFSMGATILVQTKRLLNMNLMDFCISIGGFLLPGFLLMIFIGLQFKDGLSINTEPMSMLESQLLAFSSLTLWSNLLYFARIWEVTGMYIQLFRHFITSIWKFIFLIVVFLIIAADYFRIVGGANSKLDPMNPGQYYEAPFDSLYISIKYSIQWGLLADDTIKKIDFSDSKQMLVVVWFVLSLIITLIVLNLLIAVISWLFEEVLSTYVESNQLAKAQLLSSVQGMTVSRKTETSIHDKFIVATFYPSFEGELEVRKDFFLEKNEVEANMVSAQEEEDSETEYYYQLLTNGDDDEDSRRSTPRRWYSQK